MIKLVERAGDRLLGMVVPKLSAAADPCYSCSPIGGVYWGTTCLCDTVHKYKFRWRQHCTSCGWVDDGCQPYSPYNC